MGHLNLSPTVKYQFVLILSGEEMFKQDVLT